MTYEEAIKWFEESPFMHEGHEPYEMAINALKLVAEQTEPNSKVSETPTSSEKPNNCEHITEDGVTCAKYPACGDCLDNPLNKVKGSERLVKGSEQTEPTISKMELVDKDINVRSKDEPHIVGKHADVIIIDEPQTERSE